MFPQLRKMRCNAGGAGQQVIRPWPLSNLEIPYESFSSAKGPRWEHSITLQWITSHGRAKDSASLHLTLCCCTSSALARHELFFLDPVLVQDKTVTCKLIAVMSLLHKNAPCHCPDCISSNLNRKSGSITLKAKKILKRCEHKLAFNLLPSCRACSLVYFSKKWCYSIGFHCRVGRILSPENCHLLL